MREHWLNGWKRNGNGILMGASAHCVGCGKCLGLACVAIEEDWKAPEKLPDWPFVENDCPVCFGKILEPEPITIEIISMLPLSMLREAIAIRKSKRLNNED